MSDVAVTLLIGSVLWFFGGAAFVASVLSGATLFAPFAGAVVLLGVGYCLYALIAALRG